MVTETVTETDKTANAAPVRRVAVRGLTIDSAHSRDLDDAFWVEVREGGYVIDVSVADVAAAVKPGKAVDIEARARKATEYLRDFNRPMIPPRLAEGECSLLPGMARKVVTTRIYLDESFGVERVELLKGTLTSAAKLSHSNCDVILMTADHELHAQLGLCQAAATAFFQRRRARGACAFYDVASNLYADDDGALQKYEGDFFHAQMIVQEMMIVANEQQALFMAKANVPFIYRNHKASSSAPGRDEVNRQVKEALLQRELLGMLYDRMHLWMNRATYGTELCGHYGLNVTAYAHTTSPIRRYVDLVNQRIVKATIMGHPSTYSADELAEIAAELTAWQQAQKDGKDAAMKARTIAARRQQLTAESFAGITPERFTQLLKRAVKEDLQVTEITIELGARAQAGKLGPFDIYYVLFEAGPAWREAQAAILAGDGVGGPNAVSALNIAQSRLGLVFELFVDGDAGGPFFGWARVTHDGTKTRTVDPAQASNRKGAGAAAALAWLVARVAGTLMADDGGPLSAARVPAVPKASNPVAVPKAEANWVGIVLDHCTAKSLPPPTCTFKSSGPPHLPVVTCTVTSGAREVAAAAGSKKEAKRLAFGELAKAMAVGGRS